jgi:hypothetical protein
LRQGGPGSTVLVQSPVIKPDEILKKGERIG